MHGQVCDLVCPDKRQAFLNVSLSRNTVAERACEFATNLHKQLVKKGKDFIAYSLAVNESSATSDTAQLSIFIVEWSQSVHYRGTFRTTICVWPPTLYQFFLFWPTVNLSLTPLL